MERSAFSRFPGLSWQRLCALCLCLGLVGSVGSVGKASGISGAGVCKRVAVGVKSWSVLGRGQVFLNLLSVGDCCVASSRGVGEERGVWPGFLALTASGSPATGSGGGGGGVCVCQDMKQAVIMGMGTYGRVGAPLRSACWVSDAA